MVKDDGLINRGDSMESAINQGAPAATAIEPSAKAAQYLTFILGNEQYGVDILRVQEIRGWSVVTRLPNSPPYMLGVLNLRGAIVPIVDMRLRFNLEQAEYTALTVIIVLSVHTGAGRQVFGAVVDGVSDVLDMPPDSIKPAPDFGTAVNTEYISGIATTAGRMVMLLDVDRMLSADELMEVSAAKGRTQ